MPQKVDDEAGRGQDGEADLITTLLAYVLGHQHRDGYTQHGGHQKEDHRQGRERLVPVDVLEVVDQDALDKVERRQIEGVGGQDDHVRLVAEHRQEGGEKLLGGLRRLAMVGFLDRQKSDEGAEGHEQTQDSPHEGKTRRPVVAEYPHQGKDGAGAQDRSDHRETEAIAIQRRALVVIAGQFGGKGGIRNVHHRIGRIEEAERHRRPNAQPKLILYPRIGEEKPHGQRQRKGAEQQVRSASPPAAPGPVRGKAHQGIGHRIPELAHHYRRAGGRRSQPHGIREVVEGPEAHGREKKITAQVGGSKSQLRSLAQGSALHFFPHEVRSM